MSKHQTILHCSRTTATWILILVAALFWVSGCAALFRAAGHDTEQAQLAADQLHADLTAAAAAAVTDITSGIAQGQDFKTIAARASSALIWKLTTIAASTAGTLLTALLAKWLGTERKISKALITGVEKSNNRDTKETIASIAGSAGIEPQLNARVKALT